MAVLAIEVCIIPCPPLLNHCPDDCEHDDGCENDIALPLVAAPPRHEHDGVQVVVGGLEDEPVCSPANGVGTAQGSGCDDRMLLKVHGNHGSQGHEDDDHDDGYPCLVCFGDGVVQFV